MLNSDCLTGAFLRSIEVGIGLKFDVVLGEEFKTSNLPRLSIEITQRTSDLENEGSLWGYPIRIGP